jgi:hypothetical protein
LPSSGRSVQLHRSIRRRVIHHVSSPFIRLHTGTRKRSAFPSFSQVVFSTYTAASTDSGATRRGQSANDAPSPVIWKNASMTPAHLPPPSSSRPQVRRVVARRTFPSGDTPKLRLAVPDSNQGPPHPGLQSSSTLTTPPLSNEDQNISLVPPSQDVQPLVSISFTRVQPCQKYHDQDHPPVPPTAKTGTKHPSLSARRHSFPSSPLLKSTVADSPASEQISHRHPQTNT